MPRYFSSLSRENADLALKLLLVSRDELAPPALLDLARLHRQRNEWQAANAIWTALAEQGNPEAIEAQAKYLEHRERDYAQALERVDRLPPGPEREYRRRRLEGKLRASLERFDQATGVSRQGKPFPV